MNVDAPQLVSIDRVALLLGVKRTLVTKLIYAGEIPSLTVGRRRLVATDDLATFLARRKRSEGALGYDPDLRPLR